VRDEARLFYRRDGFKQPPYVRADLVLRPERKTSLPVEIAPKRQLSRVFRADFSRFHDKELRLSASALIKVNVFAFSFMWKIPFSFDF